MSAEPIVDQSFSSRDAASPARRSLILFSGIVLVAAGQWLVLRADPTPIRFGFSSALNTFFRLDLPNIDNVLLGLALLIIGAVLFGMGIAARGDSHVGGQLSGRVQARHAAPPQLSYQPVPARHAVPPQAMLLPAALLLAALALSGWLLARLAQIDETRWLPLVWLASVGLLLAALLALDRRAQVVLRSGLPWREWLIVAGLVVLGLTVGTYRLASVPNSLLGDEGGFWDKAQTLVTGAYQPTIFGFGVYSYPILSTFYQAGVLKLFGMSLWGWRFSSVLAGVLAVVPTYLLARELFGRRVAIVAGVMMVTLPYFIAFERLGYNNSQSLAPVALALYLLYSGLRRQSALYLGLSGVAAGIGFYTYTAGRLALVVAALFLLYLLVARRRGQALPEGGPATIGGLLLLGACFGAAWAVTALPHIVYGNAHDPDLLRYKLLESLFPNVNYARWLFDESELFRDYLPIAYGQETFFYRPDLYARLLVRGVVRTLLAFHHDGLIYEHFIAAPLAGPLTTIFYTCGLVVAFVRLRRVESVLLLLWFVSGLALLSMINTYPPRYQHFVPIIPALAILIALGLVAVLDAFAAELAAHNRIVAPALTAVVLTVAGVAGVRHYFVDVQARYPPNAEHVMAFAALDPRAPQHLVYVYSNPAEEKFVPWLIEHMDHKATYRTISREAVANGELILDPHSSYTIFFHENDRFVVIPFLERTLGRQVFPDLHLNRNGDIVLVSFSFESSQ